MAVPRRLSFLLPLLLLLAVTGVHADDSYFEDMYQEMLQERMDCFAARMTPITQIAKTVSTIYIGFDGPEGQQCGLVQHDGAVVMAPQSTDGGGQQATTTTTPIGKFYMTRLVWSIVPAPEGVTETTVSSFPENLVSTNLTTATDVEGGGGPLTLSFQPNVVVNYTGEAGVLIQVPRDQLHWIKLESRSATATGGHAVQIDDGFTALESIDISTPLSMTNKDMLPGQGPIVQARILSSDTPLSLRAQGNGLAVQVQAPVMKEISIHTYNSEFDFKTSLDAAQVTLEGGSLSGCQGSGCGTKIRMEGEIGRYFFAVNGKGDSRQNKLDLQVRDYTHLFDCEYIAPDWPTKGSCSLLDVNAQGGYDSDVHVCDDPPLPCVSTSRMYLQPGLALKKSDNALACQGTNAAAGGCACSLSDLPPAAPAPPASAAASSISLIVASGLTTTICLLPIMTVF